MKKILVLLIILFSFVGLSVISFAYTLIQPPACYVEPFKDAFILTPKLKTSTMNSKWKSIWNDFVSIYKGRKSGHYLITYRNGVLRFFVLSSNAELKSTTSSKTAFMYIPYDNSFMYLLDFYPSGGFIGGIYPPDDWGTYLVDVDGTIIKSSLPTTNRKISAVLDLNGKHLYINDDLGMLNPYHNLIINYQYSNGTQAFETYTNTFSQGDSFSISSPALDGFKSSISTISGQMGNVDLNYTVTYTPINHSVTVNYQYDNGSKALEPYSGTFSEGQPYSIPTPTIKGYTPSLNIISGEMGTSDLSYTVIFTKVKEPDSSSSSSNSSSGNSGSSGSGGNSSGNSGSSGSGSASNGNTKEDYIAFDSETVTSSINLFRNNLKPITNIALYGMLVLIGVFAVLEIIHKIAL